MDTDGSAIAEVGIPYSDPIADGPVIQASYTRALNAGVKFHDIMQMIGQVAQQQPGGLTGLPGTEHLPVPGVVAEGRRVITNMERVSALFVTKTVYAAAFAVVTLGHLVVDGLVGLVVTFAMSKLWPLAEGGR